MSASKITLQFNKAMSDPTGKEAEFSVIEGDGDGGGGDYQEWENFPDSPLLTSTYIYQCIVYRYTTSKYTLIMSPTPLYRTVSGGTGYIKIVTGQYKEYQLIGGAWVFYQDLFYYNAVSYTSTTPLDEANNDVYGDVGLTTVFFEQTTSSSSTTLTIDSITQPTTTTYQVNIAETLTDTDVITCDYTKGTVTSADGGVLASFSTSVTNSVWKIYT